MEATTRHAAQHAGIFPEFIIGITGHRDVAEVLSDECEPVSVLQQPQSVRLRRDRATR
jgi:hypothetical protein